MNWETSGKRRFKRSTKAKNARVKYFAKQRPMEIVAAGKAVSQDVRRLRAASAPHPPPHAAAAAHTGPAAAAFQGQGTPDLGGRAQAGVSATPASSAHFTPSPHVQRPLQQPPLPHAGPRLSSFPRTSHTTMSAAGAFSAYEHEGVALNDHFESATDLSGFRNELDREYTRGGSSGPMGRPSEQLEGLAPFKSRRLAPCYSDDREWQMGGLGPPAAAAATHAARSGAPEYDNEAYDVDMLRRPCLDLEDANATAGFEQSDSGGAASHRGNGQFGASAARDFGALPSENAASSQAQRKSSVADVLAEQWSLFDGALTGNGHMESGQNGQSRSSEGFDGDSTWEDQDLADAPLANAPFAAASTTAAAALHAGATGRHRAEIGEEALHEGDASRQLGLDALARLSLSPEVGAAAGNHTLRFDGQGAAAPAAAALAERAHHREQGEEQNYPRGISLRMAESADAAITSFYSSDDEDLEDRAPLSTPRHHPANFPPLLSPQPRVARPPPPVPPLPLLLPPGTADLLPPVPPPSPARPPKQQRLLKRAAADDDDEEEEEQHGEYKEEEVVAFGAAAKHGERPFRTTSRGARFAAELAAATTASAENDGGAAREVCGCAGSDVVHEGRRPGGANVVAVSGKGPPVDEEARAVLSNTFSAVVWYQAIARSLEEAHETPRI